MRATTTNVGQVFSIGLFFSLMLAGLAASLPQSMERGLLGQHIPPAIAVHQVAETPPVASLFAAFLGYNPTSQLIPPEVLYALPAADAARCPKDDAAKRFPSLRVFPSFEERMLPTCR
jgi:hypothetical protein